MDNQYLQDLIDETKLRGGMILNAGGKPEVVVLTVEKYNELISTQKNTEGKTEEHGRELNTMEKIKKILVTGGAGYIGSHAVDELIQNGLDVVIVDNLSCGKRENLHPAAKFYEGNIGDLNFLRDIFATEKIDVVIHFAASIEVEESVRQPEKYFENNVVNTSRLLEAMNEAGVKRIIYSSTAAVYGDDQKTPIAETAKVHPNNPYGYSKLLAEKCIKYFCQYAGFSAVVFRYFNACGCRADGSVIPTHHSHLIDNVMEVAVGNKPVIKVFGHDFATFDGSGVRDYVHVKDIARAHLVALEKFQISNFKFQNGESDFQVFNIGTGKGKSVLEIVNTASEILGKIIPMEVVERRAGDAAETVADNSKIFQAWGFLPEHSDLETILNSAYKQKVFSQKYK